MLALALVVGMFAFSPGTAFAVDNDGDGRDAGPADCNDSDATIYSGAPELCDGKDNDCDTLTDEFAFDRDLDGAISAEEAVSFAGESCVYDRDGPGGLGGECLTGGAATGLVCNVNQLECPAPVAPLNIWQAEKPSGGGYGNCNDGVDNDCDGTIDLADLTDDGVTASACDFGGVEVRCDGVDEDAQGGIDDDFTFSDALNTNVAVGGVCVAGIGACERSGTVFCSVDQLGTTCSATPKSPGIESHAAGTCNDGVDNDCDGDTDGDDSTSCPVLAVELCNTVDDDGDFAIDEGFPGLGLVCSDGFGVCKQFGTNVCTSTTTVGCSVSGDPTQSVAENSADLCKDGLDNDCDGAVDSVDADCAAFPVVKVDLGVWCQLPYDTRGRPGSDCTGKSTIGYGADFAGAEVRADLLALDSNFNVLNTFENVVDGATAHLASRVDPADWKWSVKTSKKGAVTVYETYAPIPVLRVTATLGDGPTAIQQEAYCSIRPYMDLTKPSGETIVLDSNGEESLDVVVQIPLLDVDTLQIWVDGVQVTDGIVVDPVPDFPTLSGPICDDPAECIIMIEAGCGDDTLVPVEVRDLSVKGLDTDIVDSVKEGISEPMQTNILSFSLVGLPAGGHIVYVTADPLPEVADLDIACNVDDLEDSGIMSAFGIRIDTPTHLQTNVVPGVDEVTGNICGGYEIASLMINGGDVDVSGQTCDPGSPPNSAPECYFDFEYPIALNTQLDLADGEGEAGKYSKGANRVIADGKDVENNRVIKSDIVFGIGTTASPGAAPLALQAQQSLWEAVEPSYLEAQAQLAATLQNAFVVGLEENGASAFFNAQCVEALNTFRTQATNAIQGKSFGDVDIQPGCSCDLNNVPVVLEELVIDPADPLTSCIADFTGPVGPGGQVDVTVNLPDIAITVGAEDSCEDHGLFGECIARTTIDVQAKIKLINLTFKFSITESSTLTKPDPVPDANPMMLWQMTDKDGNTAKLDLNGNGWVDSNETIDCDPLPAEYATLDACKEASKNFNKNPAFDPVTQNVAEIDCWGAELCQVGQVIGAVFIEIFTLSLADGFEIVDFLDFDWTTNPDFLEELQASKPDAMNLDDVRMDEDAVSDIGHATYQVTMTAVDIVGSAGANANDGLVVAFSAEVENQSPNPDFMDSVGAVVEAPPIPGVTDIVAPEDISIVISTDVFNQVFASMKDSGLLSNQCISSGKTIANLLPDCETIGVPEGTPEGQAADPDTAAGAATQGICHAILGTDCESLTNPDETRQAQEQGACHGFNGEECTDVTPLFPLAERTACAAAKLLSVDIEGTDEVLLCVQADLEPNLVFSPESDNNEVPVQLLLNDLSAAFVLDRGNDGYDGTLADLAAVNCFKKANNAAPDCMVYSVCLDLTVNAVMTIDTNNAECLPGQTGFLFGVTNVITSGKDGTGDPDYGQLCSAVADTPDEQIEEVAGTSTEVEDDLTAAATEFMPPFCADGLTLGNAAKGITFSLTNLYSISTQAPSGQADYLGLGGQLNFTQP